VIRVPVLILKALRLVIKIPSIYGRVIRLARSRSSARDALHESIRRSIHATQSSIDSQKALCGTHKSLTPANLYQISILEARVEHLNKRLEMPGRLRDRMPVIIAEYKSGRYSEHSSGWRSALRDLIG
jgi:hypothetical protein